MDKRINHYKAYNIFNEANNDDCPILDGDVVEDVGTFTTSPYINLCDIKYDCLTEDTSIGKLLDTFHELGPRNT